MGSKYNFADAAVKAGHTIVILDRLAELTIITIGTFFMFLPLDVDESRKLDVLKRYNSPWSKLLRLSPSFFEVDSMDSGLVTHLAVRLVLCYVYMSLDAHRDLIQLATRRCHFFHSRLSNSLCQNTVLRL